MRLSVQQGDFPPLTSYAKGFRVKKTFKRVSDSCKLLIVNTLGLLFAGYYFLFRSHRQDE